MKDTKLIIIDSSVAIKWFFLEDTESTKRARAILENFKKNSSVQLWYPDIILFEFSNVLCYKRDLTDEQSQEIWQSFCSLPANVYIPSCEFISETLEFARKYKVTTYDASYAVLAKEKKGVFVTADKMFVNQVNESFVKLL